MPVRHEQGGAYIADVCGRLTGHAGVCLGTLGPGALNLVTAVADAYLDRAPLVVLTGQGDLERMHKESHQYIDLLRVMRPITKWNARLSDARIIPGGGEKGVQGGGGREARGHAYRAARGRDGRGRSRRRRFRAARQPEPEPQARDLLKAADIIRGALNPVILAGNGTIRGGATPALREFVRATGIPVAETFMGRGLLPSDDPKQLGSVGLQAGDYAMAGFDEADVVLAVGYDLVEHSPQHWNPGRDKKIICIDSLPAEIDEYFIPQVELAGDLYHILTRLAEECRHVPHKGGSARLREVVLGRLKAAQGRRCVPRATSAGPLGDPAGAGPGGHPGVGRRACTSSGSGGCSPLTSPTPC